MANCNQNFASHYKVRRLMVSAGRQSVGSWKVYLGDIVQCSLSQPADIMTTLRCTTNARDRSNWWAWANTGPVTILQVVKSIAQLLNLSYTIDSAAQSTVQKVLPSFTFNGPAVAAVIRLQEMGNIRAYIDDDTLVITNKNAGLSNNVVQVNASTGMVGIPEFTEYGIRVKTLADRNIVLGGAINLTSVMVPIMNGNYVVSRIDYDLSTREQAFYYDVWAYRSG